MPVLYIWENVPQPPSTGPRPRAFVHRGVVEASGILVEEALAGAEEARRRVVRAWGPGVTVHRLEEGLLVRFPDPRPVDCGRAAGAPLVPIGPARRAALSSAPLTAEEIAAIAPPDGAVVLVHGGAFTCAVPPAAADEDPAGYLDLSGFAPIPVVPLGPAPPPPRVATDRAQPPARQLLGIGAEPDAQARLLAALRDARRGRAPVDEPRASFFARLLATLASFFRRVFPGNAAARAGAGAPAGRSALAVAAAPPAGPSFLQRFTAALRNLVGAALVRANLAPFLGRRQAEYLGRMLDLFDRGELSEALRHAIPLGGEGEDGAAGDARPMLGVPSPRRQLAISGGRGGVAGPTLFTPEDLYADLRRRYREAFERLEREGRIEEAAFVLAELLRESAEAVAFLERHGRLQLAAEIAEARGLPPGLLVRQWLLAGDAARAVLLARRHGAFADALGRLEGHTGAAVLRMLWASSLADAGDFAAAVDMAWPLPEGRRTAEAWIDAAIAQGGAAGARMLARKLSLLHPSFPDIRDRALVLLADDTGSPAERRAFAEALLAAENGAGGAGARTLARATIRALVRDGGRTGDPATRLLVERLEAFAGDDLLRADRPGWPTIARTSLAQRAAVRTHTIGPADTGATAVHDAAHLPDGRTLLALGEAGIRVLGRSGRPAFDLDQPAHRLVVSDRGDRALALARRGDAWRVSRIDLVGRRSEVWCEARFDGTAPDFDGSQWVIAAGRRLLVIDALDARFEALAALDLGEAVTRVHAIARGPTCCAVALEEEGAPLSRRVYELPSWTLRHRGTVAAAPVPSRGPTVFTAGPHGAVAFLSRLPAGERADGRSSLLGATLLDGATLEAWPAVPASGAQPAAVQVAPGWLAAAFLSKGGLYLRLHDASAMKERAEILVSGSRAIALRLGAETLTVADDRGRVLVVELAQGGVVSDARV